MRQVAVHYMGDLHSAETYDRKNYDLTREPGGLLITQKSESHLLPDPYRKFVPWHRIDYIMEYIKEEKNNA